jgi:hypothetical protein
MRREPVAVLARVFSPAIRDSPTATGMDPTGVKPICHPTRLTAAHAARCATRRKHRELAVLLGSVLSIATQTLATVTASGRTDVKPTYEAMAVTVAAATIAVRVPMHREFVAWVSVS